MESKILIRYRTVRTCTIPGAVSTGTQTQFYVPVRSIPDTGRLFVGVHFSKVRVRIHFVLGQKTDYCTPTVDVLMERG